MKVTRLGISKELEEITETEVFEFLTGSEARVKFFQYGNFGRKLPNGRRIVALNMGNSGGWGSPSKHTGLFIPQEKSVYIVDHDEQALHRYPTDDYQVWHRDADSIFEEFKFDGDPKELVDLFIANNYRLV